MAFQESLAVVAQQCRFVPNPRAAAALIPELERNLPPFTLFEYLDASQGGLLGYPVVRSPRLCAEVYRLIVSEVGRLLHDIDAPDESELFGLEALRSDPYHRVLTDLLVRAASQGPALRLDSILWLHLTRTIASFLNQDPELLGWFGRCFPVEAHKGDRYLLDLLRTKGTQVQTHARIKDRVLRSLWVRHELAIASATEVLPHLAPNPILRELAATRVAFTERPDGLYTFFDLREIFALRDFRVEHDDFVDLQRTIRAVIADAYLAYRGGRATAEEAWLVSRYATDEVLDKAGRLELADGSLQAAAGGGDPDEFPERIAWLLSLQEESASYVLFHLERFGFLKSVTRRHELRRDFLKRLKHPEDLRAFVGPYNAATRDVLRWDLFNTLTGLIRPVERQEARLLHDGRALRFSVVPTDFESAHEVYRRRRYGTAVVMDLGDFGTRTSEVFLGDSGGEAGKVEATPDFGSLCVQRLFVARDKAAAWRGRTAWLAGSRTLDLFPRAIDAVRFVSAFLDGMVQSRHVRVGPLDPPQVNPFSQEVRIALGTGEWADLTVPSADPVQDGLPHFEPAGRVIDDVIRLVAPPTSSEAVARASTEEYDPIEVFRVRVVQRSVENRGIACAERTWKEIAAAVRLEGIAAWSPRDPDVRICGRRIELKNYRFETIWEDSATGQVLLTRKVEGAVDSRGSRPRELQFYEILIQRKDEFLAFLDRATDIARHQAPRAGVGSGSMPKVEAVTSGARSIPRMRAHGGRGPGLDEPARSVASMTGMPAVSTPPKGGVVPPPRPTVPPAPPLRPAQAPHRPAAAPGSAISLPDLPGLNLPAAEDFQFGDFVIHADDTPDPWGPHPLGSPSNATLPAAARSLAQELGIDPGPSPFSLGGPSPRPGVVSPSRTDPSARRIPAVSSGALAEEEPDPPADPAFDALAFPEAGAWAADPRGWAEAVAGFVAGAPEDEENWRGSASEQRVIDDDGPVGISLLGVLNLDFVARLQRVELELARPVGAASRVVPSQASPKKERLAVTRPDFAALFKDYVWFWIGPPKAPGAAIAIGRRYRDVLFDLHRFSPTAGAHAGFEVEDAVTEFLRQKVGENFVPQHLSYEEIPADAGEILPLPTALLDRAFARVVR